MLMFLAATEPARSLVNLKVSNEAADGLFRDFERLSSPENSTEDANQRCRSQQPGPGHSRLSFRASVALGMHFCSQQASASDTHLKSLSISNVA
jgi:hypothetical protein